MKKNCEKPQPSQVNVNSTNSYINIQNMFQLLYIIFRIEILRIQFHT